MSLKAVLFDMDGVIVDTEPLHRKAYFGMFRHYGMHVSEALFKTFTGRTTDSVCLELIDKYNLDAQKEELVKKKRKIFKELFDNDPEFDLLPGVRSLIQHYFDNDIKLVLASSASNTTIEMVFIKFKLDPFFVGKISGADLKESKPHPEIFLRAAEIANEPIENCMVIEDSTNGILASHRAGIFCAAYKSEHTLGQDYTLANILVDNYEELELFKIAQHFS
ncbi:HAD family hydrolase [Soonwooa sp.]|uniref:HAD family hydrolase n=1 Tax=Soonwooa sp. TaxID=1938592 RepID=UPI0035ADAD80